MPRGQPGSDLSASSETNWPAGPAMLHGSSPPSPQQPSWLNPARGFIANADMPWHSVAAPDRVNAAGLQGGWALCWRAEPSGNCGWEPAMTEKEWLESTDPR